MWAKYYIPAYYNNRACGLLKRTIKYTVTSSPIILFSNCTLYIRYYYFPILANKI